MPAPTPIKLSTDEEAIVKRNLTSGKTPVRLRERSEIVLLAASGLPNYKIAEQMNIDVNRAGRWRNRYAQEGYAGIEKDRPRGGNHCGKDRLAAGQTRIWPRRLKSPRMACTASARSSRRVRTGASRQEEARAVSRPQRALGSTRCSETSKTHCMGLTMPSGKNTLAAISARSPTDSTGVSCSAA